MKCARTMIGEPKKQRNLFRRLLLPGFIGLLNLLGGADSGLAQISIDGVNDKQVYADSVSFTVYSEAGYDYTVELNGHPMATDVAVEVTEPEYFELYVYRREQSSGSVESELVQFIVRASERGNTEVGLPLWTPYPSIDSAAAEFAGASLEIIMPAAFPLGLEIPVIARVEDGSGNRVGVNGTITAAGFAEQPLQLLRGVGYVFLPAATEAGVLDYTAEIQTLQTPKQITIEGSTTWQTVSSDIITSIDWGEDARVHISGVGGDILTIASGATLTIGAGSVILIDPDIEIAVEGEIVVNGAGGRPVVFTTQDRNDPWGGFLFESSQAQGEFHGTIFTASGADSNWFNTNPGHGHSHRKNQCLFYLSNGAQVNLTDCYAVENHGQLGHGEGSYLTMIGCLVQKCVTAGQYNGGAVILEDCALIEFPSATAPFADDDSDVFYLTGGAHSLTDCLVGWCLDDGIDAGDGAAGSVTVTGCWFESIYHEAMAWSSGPRDADIRDSVVLNCGQGIECGYGDPDVDTDHCLSTANVIGARFGDNYGRTYNGFLNVSDSLLLFNVRDVWGRAWDDWTVHLNQMDIQNNFLSAPNANYPNNRIWDPQGDPNQREELMAFLPTPADTVGLGPTVLTDTFTLEELTNKIPVRLSTFTRQFVSVDYTIYTEDGLYDSGTLHFIPGQTIQHIRFTPPPPEDLREVRILLSNPVHAELTGYQQLVFSKPYEIVEPLIQEGDDWHYFKGTEEPRTDWNQLGFIPDPNWLEGPTPIGYENSSGYEACLATSLDDMRNSYISVYALRQFYIEDPSRLIRLTFTIDWDDGYIAYLNGFPVDSQYPPDPPTYDEPATTGNHEACCGTSTPTGPCPPEAVDLTDFRDDLVAGYNVLAVQVHNQSISSSDFLFNPELYGIVTPWPGDFEPDGDVDFVDYVVLASAWLTEYGQLRYNPLCDISISPDGQIDLGDLIVFFANWLAGY